MPAASSSPAGHTLARVGARHGRTVAALTLVGTLVAACSTSSSSHQTTVGTVSDSTTTTIPRADDGVLEIGVLLPQTGPSASIGQAMTKAVQLAVTKVNDAGGVLGHRVQVSVADEGGDPAGAQVGLTTLLARPQIDAVIGPLASADAVALWPVLTAARVLTCSPAATTTAIDSFSGRDLFVRTAPANTMQGWALASVMYFDHRTRVAVLAPDNYEGGAVRGVLVKALAANNIALTASRAYDPAGTDFTADASAVVATKPTAVVVIGGPDVGPRVVAALASSHLPVYVNSGLRLPGLPLKADPHNLGAGPIKGVSVAADPGSGAGGYRAAFNAFAPEDQIAFSSYAYDCATLIAIAAALSGSDNPPTLRAGVIRASRGGIICRTFLECVRLPSQGFKGDYDGASGPLELTADGSPSRANFDVFAFDDSGKDVTMQELQVTTG